MKNKAKIIEVITIIFFVIALAYFITVGVITKNTDKLCIAVWVTVSLNYFVLYRQAIKFGDERVSLRDDIIEEQMKLIDKQTVLIHKQDELIIEQNKEIESYEERKKNDEQYT